jgi:SAM-dependent methyltransferase
MQFLKSLEVKVRRFRDKLSPLLYSGNRFHCPVCNRSFRKFRSAGRGERKRQNAVCPYCISRERDRLVFSYLKQQQSKFFNDSTRLLHIAPEPCLEPSFQKWAKGLYLTADLIRKDVNEQFDVMSIPHPNRSFDAVFCSHVLQDVPDDIQAMKEFFRVLVPGGWAILNVPVVAKQSADHREQPRNIRKETDARPDEHLRSYGEDYPDRMRGAGFEVEVVNAQDLFDGQSLEKMAMNRPETGSVYIGTKPSTVHDG